MSKIHVQEHNKLSGSNHLSARGFDDIKSAYAELRFRAIQCKRSFSKWDKDSDSIINNATVESNKTDTVTITNGRAVRIFTLVTKRGGEPIPFGHLLRLNRVEPVT